MLSSSSPILVVRLGAMGDIIHALPGAASLKLSFPERRLVWIAARKWLPLFEGNPHIDEVISYSRDSVAELSATWKALRALKVGLAIDFQGLIQSALVGRAANPAEFVGLDKTCARESAAAFIYSKRVRAVGPHRVERGLQLASAAGATILTTKAWLPEGRPEGTLPHGPFVLASPFAGWVSKQWPLEYYAALAEKLKTHRLSLVVNVPESNAAEMASFPELHVHCSSIAGLIDATRRAHAVVGVDSGPLHMAAALHKRGVAIYGPTDPVQTGPFASPMRVLRVNTVTTYKREDVIHPSMRAIKPEQVVEALLA